MHDQTQRHKVVWEISALRTRMIKNIVITTEVVARIRAYSKIVCLDKTADKVLSFTRIKKFNILLMTILFLNNGIFLRIRAKKEFSLKILIRLHGPSREQIFPCILWVHRRRAYRPRLWLVPKIFINWHTLLFALQVKCFTSKS